MGGQKKNLTVDTKPEGSQPKAAAENRKHGRDQTLKNTRRIRTHFGHIPDASRTHFGRISDASGKEMKRKEEEEEEEGENEWQFQQLIVLFLFYVIKINMTFLNVFNLKPMFF